MEHVVFFPTPDGGTAFRRFAGLEEAVRFVEHLRNVEGVSECSLHALTEVPLAFRAYYKVEMAGGAEHVAADAASVEVPAPTAAPDDAPVAELVETPLLDTPLVEAGLVEAGLVEAGLVESGAASPNGKRSLGFFAH